MLRARFQGDEDSKRCRQFRSCSYDSRRWLSSKPGSLEHKFLRAAASEKAPRNGGESFSTFGINSNAVTRIVVLHRAINDTILIRQHRRTRYRVHCRRAALRENGAINFDFDMNDGGSAVNFWHGTRDSQISSAAPVLSINPDGIALGRWIHNRPHFDE